MKQEKKNEKKILELIKNNDTKNLINMCDCKLDTVVYTDDELLKYNSDISKLLIKLSKNKNYDFRNKNKFKIETKEIVITFD